MNIYQKATDYLELANQDILSGDIDCDRIDTDVAYRWAVITKLQFLAKDAIERENYQPVKKHPVDHYFDMTFPSY